jgi:predicted MFS family arabinose efflux permease
MFLNLAANSQRGTANSTLLTAWDLGVGLGIILGGFIAEHTSYNMSFWAAWICNAVGVLFFFAYAKGHFERNKLR